MFSRCIYLHQLQDQWLTCEQSLNICFKGAFCTRPIYLPQCWWCTHDDTFGGSPPKESDSLRIFHQSHASSPTAKNMKCIWKCKTQSSGRELLLRTHCAELQGHNGKKLQSRKWCDGPVLLHPCSIMKSDLFQSEGSITNSNPIHGGWNIWDNNPWMWAQACSMQDLNSH